MKQINRLKRFLLGEPPIYIVNNGKPIDVVTIQYKDLYLFVDIDTKSSEPTGGFGWSHDPTMNPTVPIREIWTAAPPKKATKAKGSAPPEKGEE